MSVLGYTTKIDPETRKRCLDLWLETGSAYKAGRLMGMSHVSIRYHAWNWILTHPEESRQLLDSLSESDQRFYRLLTDDEYWHMLTRHALQYFKSEKKIDAFVSNNELWKYHDAYSMLETRYPRTYKKYLDKVSA